MLKPPKVPFPKDGKITEVIDEVPKIERPHLLEAEVYKIKSAFVKNSVYVTIGYLKTEEGRKPFEIFLNSKDLTKAPEYAVLTRLLSSIFRVVDDPTFVIEELKSINDPNGGCFKNGKYMHSFYSEVAEILESAFKPKKVIEEEVKPVILIDDNMKICPECGEKSCKYENGCMSCTNPECGYSKCDH